MGGSKILQYTVVFLECFFGLLWFSLSLAEGFSITVATRQTARFNFPTLLQSCKNHEVVVHGRCSCPSTLIHSFLNLGHCAIPAITPPYACALCAHRASMTACEAYGVDATGGSSCNCERGRHIPLSSKNYGTPGPLCVHEGLSLLGPLPLNPLP